MSPTAIQAAGGLKYFHCATQVLLDTDETGQAFSLFCGGEGRTGLVLSDVKRVKVILDQNPCLTAHGLLFDGS